MRHVFTTSRLAEFATPQGLTTRVGRPPEWWPDVAVKELIDNAADAAETAGLPPVIAVTIADDTIVVADQGPGIDPEVVRRIFDYERQTSSRPGARRAMRSRRYWPCPSSSPAGAARWSSRAAASGMTSPSPSTRLRSGRSSSMRARSRR